MESHSQKKTLNDYLLLLVKLLFPQNPTATCANVTIGNIDGAF
jgi:hypothetical protein